MIFCVVYVSTAKHEMTTSALTHLLTQARERNASLGITGALLYRDGMFLQAIEGDEQPIVEVFRSIKADPRHHEVEILVYGVTDERQFDDWTMAFRDLTGGSDEVAEGFSSFMRDRDATFGDEPTAAQRLLLKFRGTLAPSS